MRAISLRIVLSSKIIPHIITIQHQSINSHMHPTVGQLATTQTCLPITQTLGNLLEQLKQQSITNTKSHSTCSHRKSQHNNTDRHKHKYHNMDTKHNGNYNRSKLHSGNTHNRTHHSRHNHRTRVNEIKEFRECSSDCTDLSDWEEQVNTETPDNTKNQFLPLKIVQICMWLWEGLNTA